MRRHCGSPIAVQAYRPSNGQGVLFEMTGEEGGLTCVEMRDLFQAFAPIPAPPLCDVELKT
jgi:hypothetical protein